MSTPDDSDLFIRPLARLRVGVWIGIALAVGMTITLAFRDRAAAWALGQHLPQLVFLGLTVQAVLWQARVHAGDLAARTKIAEAAAEKAKRRTRALEEELDEARRAARAVVLDQALDQAAALARLPVPKPPQTRPRNHLLEIE